MDCLSVCLQVLTLASNERIPLNPTMRLLFEISHLRTATPATVSRAGEPYLSCSSHQVPAGAVLSLLLANSVPLNWEHSCL